MVSINIRESTFKQYGGVESKRSGLLTSHIPSHSRVCLVWILSDCVLCSHKDRGGRDRVSPTLKNGITLYILRCNLLFSFNNISKTFPISAHTFVVQFLNNNIVFYFIEVPWLIYPSLY